MHLNLFTCIIWILKNNVSSLIKYFAVNLKKMELIMLIKLRSHLLVDLLCQIINNIKNHIFSLKFIDKSFINHSLAFISCLLSIFPIWKRLNILLIIFFLSSYSYLETSIILSSSYVFYLKNSTYSFSLIFDLLVITFSLLCII